MTTKSKLKIDKTGHSLCGGYGNKGCGCQLTGIGQVIGGIEYCMKCATPINGVNQPAGSNNLPGGLEEERGCESLPQGAVSSLGADE